MNGPIRDVSRRVLVPLALCFAALLVDPSLAHGYGGDTHYYLRYALALEACFDWDEAHLIASADYMVDKNRSTTAEKHPFQEHNKINWHAFNRNEERFNALWERALAEDDPELQLVKLAQFLHYITDWESHFGYGTRIGHGIATVRGKDPDSLGANRMNNLRMIDQTIDHMVEVCVARGRNPWRGDDPDLFRSNLYKELATESILDEMFVYNTRKWKTWGVRGKKGKEILAKNHLLIEQFIERRSKRVPGRGVPADFTPGDPERGLPPPIGLRYDKDGRLLEVYGVEIELAPEYLGDRLFAMEENAYEEEMETGLVDDLERELRQEDDSDIDSNLELRILDADLAEDGWWVTVRVENLGAGASQSGALDLAVLDVVSEDLLGEESRPFVPMSGGEAFQYKVLVESNGPPTKAILIGASLTVQELSADNNDAWYVPWRAGIKADDGKRKTKKTKEDLPVDILGAPKMWVDESGAAVWVVLRALVSGGHSSRRLETLGIVLSGQEGSAPARVNDNQPVVWMSTPDLRRRVVPAETLAWFRFDDTLCAAIEKDSISPTEVEITVGGPEVRSVTHILPLSPEIAEALATACADGRNSQGS